MEDSTHLINKTLFPFIKIVENLGRGQRKRKMQTKYTGRDVSADPTNNDVTAGSRQKRRRFVDVENNCNIEEDGKDHSLDNELEPSVRNLDFRY